MRKSLILLMMLVAMPLAAQWRRANLYGADVRALIIDPARPDTLYVGTSGGEVYVSTDAARTWRNPRGGVPFPGYVVDNLVIDRTGHLWAAAWGLWGGSSIAVSSDGGATWQRRDAGLEEQSIRAIAVDPHDANFVIAGGLNGVWRSTNAGRSWEQISDQINVESVAIDPRSRDRIYVGTWRQGYRTDDGGKNWKLINAGMVLDTDMFAITIDLDKPDNMWVATCGWVYGTTNGGDAWTRYRDGFNNRRVHDVEIDPCDKDSVYAGTVAGLYRSDDKGKSWYAISDESLVVNTIALDPQRPDRIILGIEGDGVYVSNDRGKTYARSCEGLRNLTITSIAADPVIQKRVYASVVFGGASNGIYQSDDAGATWKKLVTASLPQVLSFVATEDEETKFIAGTEKGFYWSSNGSEWTQAAPSNAPIRVDKVVRYNKQRLFAATSEGVFTSRDAGKSWYRLAGSDNRTVDIALGYLGEKRAVFALTSVGLMAFDGAQWAMIEGAPAKGRTIAVLGSSGDAQRVYIAGVQGVRAGEIDAARKWRDADVPDAQFASVYSEGAFVFLTSRQQREVLVSQSNVAEWRAFPLPSRTAEVTSIAVDPFEPRRLYCGTLREGIFIFEGTTKKFEVKTAAAGAAAGSW